MNQIHYVSKYLTLSQEGLVSKMDCPLDQGLLMCNLDFDDKIFLYCLSCEYKNFLGLKAINDMITQVELLRD